MKTLFIDCNPQFELVFRRVHRADDPPVAVHNHPFQAGDLPRLLDGYDICIDDHSYMPTAEIAQCSRLKHIVFCGTGASSYMDVAALQDLGTTVHTYRGYGDTAVADLALRHLRDYARCVIQINQIIPDVVLQELADDGERVSLTAAEEVRRNANEVWKSQPGVAG